MTCELTSVAMYSILIVSQFDVGAALRRHFGEVNSPLQHQTDPLPCILVQESMPVPPLPMTIRYSPLPSAFSPAPSPLPAGQALTRSAGLNAFLRGLIKSVAKNPDSLPLSARFWWKMAGFGAILHKNKASRRARFQMGA